MTPDGFFVRLDHWEALTAEKLRRFAPLCSGLLRLVLTKHTLVTSEVVLAELRCVLCRKGRLPAQQIEAIERFLREHPVAPIPVQTLELGLVDGDDEWVLVSAVLAKADLVVTGDQGVLACIKPPLALVNPRRCLKQLGGLAAASPEILASQVDDAFEEAVDQQVAELFNS